MDYRIFELDAQTWRIEEYDETTSVYMYLLTGKDKALLLDTGMGIIDIAQIVNTLTALPVEVLCTHGHFDHIGGNPLFDTVYMHRADQKLYQLHSSKEMQAQFSGYAFRSPRDNICWFDGEPCFDLGGRPLKILHTPGHSLGSICILDVHNRWLFTGDTCCKADVLLNLDYSTTVEEYAASVLKLQELQSLFDTTWPAHHSVPVDPQILTQFGEAARMLCDGEAEGDDFVFSFGSAKRLPYKDIAIVYSPARIHK